MSSNQIERYVKARNGVRRNENRRNKEERKGIGYKKNFKLKKTHPLSKNATKRIKQVHIVPIDYQLKKRRFLIKGCAAGMSNIPISRQKFYLYFEKLKVQRR